MNKKINIIFFLFSYISRVNKLIFGYPDPESFSKKRHFIKYLNINKNFTGTILDIGSGKGYLAIFLAKKFPNSQIIGVDVNTEDIDYSRKKAKMENITNVTFERGTALNLKFADSNFDKVISTQVLEHLPQSFDKKFFQEINRVLKNGGYFVLDTPGDFFLTYSFPVLRLLSMLTTLRKKNKTLELFHSLKRYPTYELHNHVKAGFSPSELFTLYNHTDLVLQRYHYTFKNLTSVIFELRSVYKPLGVLLSPISFVLYFLENVLFEKGLNLTCQFFKPNSIPGHVTEQNV